VVTCNGLGEIIGFASILDRTPAHLRIVHHLFVTSYGPIKPRPVTALQTLFQSVMASLGHTVDRTEPTTPLPNEVHTSLLHILTIIAPTLRTLALVIEFSTWPQLPFPSALPALLELSTHHRFSGGCLRGEVFNSIS
jgi:hypothetical protein